MNASSVYRVPRIPAVPLAILTGAIIGALLIFLSGHNPASAYWAILVGALAVQNLPDTLNWAAPLVGMTLVAAAPLRGGMVNLGGDGQLVIGGLVAALVPLYLPAPGPVAAAAAILAAMLASGLYASLAAWGETRFGVPMLISSLLLSYPAVGVASYVVGFPLRDTTTGLAETVMVPTSARLPSIIGPLNVGLILIAIAAAVFVFYDRCTVGGYELRMRGLNPRFAAYGGVRLNSQTMRIMFASGAIAGLVGAIIVLGSQYRFQDGALVTPELHLVRPHGRPARRRRAARRHRSRPLLRNSSDRRFRHAARDRHSARSDHGAAGHHHPVPGDPPRSWTATAMMSFITPSLVNSAVHAMTPILLATLAGVLCGRVGVFNMAMEGQLLVGAFGAIVGSYFLGSASGGVAVAVVATVVFSLILAYGATVFRGDSVVICIGMNLLASGLTAFLLRQIFGVSGTFSDPAIMGLEKIRIAAINAVPWIGWIFSRQTAITWVSWLLVAIVTIAMFRTPVGLRLRGVGEDASAAETMGVDVMRYRIVTVLVAGALTGLGGAQLSLGGVDIFSEDMSGGRGWIAVVAVMLGRSHPLWSSLACVLFGVADSLSVRLQGQGLPNQLTDIVPYVVTLAALAISRRRRQKNAVIETITAHT